ncbi:MAG: Rrf2 family transcriptional regulator [Oscillospiraceae bacterium]|jgi:putative two-component system response regulator|nr:Rrf2 family transcriptional regulator [Oscillospiraceae bacterium]
MQFNTTSDYAIRTVLCLAMYPDRCCTAAEIQRQMGVPATYLHKVTARLKRAGILQAEKGNGGGYRLCRTPDEVSLYDILSLTEQTLEINGCLVNESFCSRHAAETCPVRQVYSELSAVMKNSLQQTTIGSLLRK